jgi:hypothetical protein
MLIILGAFVLGVVFVAVVGVVILSRHLMYTFWR